MIWKFSLYTFNILKTNAWNDIVHFSMKATKNLEDFISGYLLISVLTVYFTKTALALTHVKGIQ